MGSGRSGQKNVVSGCLSAGLPIGLPFGRRFKEEFAPFVPDSFEHNHGGSILYIFISARLVELVGAQARSGSRRIRLNTYALIQKTFFIQLAEDPPERFNVFILKSDIRVF